MQLRFCRTDQVALAGSIPVTLWRCCSTDVDQHTPPSGIALVAELIPAPSPHHHADRELIATWLLTSQPPTMLLQPTTGIVQCEGTHARIWFGNVLGGAIDDMPLFAMVCTIAPLNKEMDAILHAALHHLPTRDQVVDADALKGLVKIDAEGPLR